MVHDLTVNVAETPLDITPTLYLFGTELDKTLDITRRKRIIIMSYIAKKCILLSWNQQRPPSLYLFKQILHETLRLEQRTYTLKSSWEYGNRLYSKALTLPYHNEVWHAHLKFIKNGLWIVTVDWFDLICCFFFVIVLLLLFFFLISLIVCLLCYWNTFIFTLDFEGELQV